MNAGVFWGFGREGGCGRPAHGGDSTPLLSLYEAFPDLYNQGPLGGFFVVLLVVLEFLGFLHNFGPI